ncbi:MFS transporter [Paenarthrobacter ureafaciens]|uniref:MFS transporter n=1 Tax=Paenarthrobacter ureafaciens TaxID=37931 RepID=UPI002DB97F9E|nr:MFS transporter [Paenarthrobacter ureafaciens]MEC3853107.1 MFS transporter [Paenarthrobacter ureafaciens]
MRSKSGTPRNTLQLILHPEFGSALAGKVILVTGFWAQTMLLVVLTFEQTHSAAWVGAITAAQLLPQLCLALVSGGMADKRGPQIPIVVGGICTGLGCIGLAIWLAVPDTVRAVPIQMPLLVASAICGVGIALASAAMQAVPPRLSEPDERNAALSLNFLPTALARTVGPIAGTALAVIFGSIATLGIVGAACIGASFIFVFIRRLGTPSDTQAPVQRLRDVLGYLRTDWTLIAVLAAVAAIGAGSEAAITLAPSIGNLLGIGASGAGWVTAAFGIGGLLGVIGFKLACLKCKTETVGCLSMALLSASIALLAIAPPLAWATALLVIAGASMVMGITGFSILAQQRSPVAFLGRVMALWVMAFTGIRPLAGISLGFISDHASPSTALLTSGVVTILASAAVFLVLSARRSSDAMTED